MKEEGRRKKTEGRGKREEGRRKREEGKSLTVLPTPYTVVIAPHPDDETLGCGGAIAFLRKLNLPVAVGIISDGTKSHPNSRKYPPSALRDLREKESLAALDILGVDAQDITFFRFPDGNVPNIGEGEFERAINLIQSYLTGLTRPTPYTSINSMTIFLPWRGDPHRDHRASWELINTAIQKLKISPRLLEYPIWTWSRQQTSDLFDSAKTWKLDISNVLDLKLQAIAQYQSQISDLIDDDPEGFRLTPEVLKHFTHPYETYLEIDKDN
jgi:LmbE family N-acetylglucosaminyl deacetylase